MKQMVVRLIFLSLLSACGKPTSNIQPVEVIYPTFYSNSPIYLEKQKNNCQQTHFFQSEIFLSSPVFISGTRDLLTENYSHLIQGLQVKNPEIISATYYGEKVEQVKSPSRIDTYLRSSPKFVELCPDVESYSAGTVESAALTSSHYIYKTYSNFTAAVPEVSVNPIILNISPLILRSSLYQDYTGETVKHSMYMTDNAFYMPSNQSISFLPHSKEMRQMGMKPNFWEVPMVISHEYGHHIFEMLYKSDSNVSGLIQECFGHPKPIEKKNNLKMLNLREVKVSDVMNSYNEGFADLIAFYTLDGNEKEVTDVLCLEVTRDVLSPKLINGKKKIFSSELIAAFFSRWEDTTSSCNNPSFQDTHVLGAVFAYSANSFLSELTDSNQEKLQVLVEWVKHLNSNRKMFFLSPAENFLEDTFYDFVEIGLSKFNRTFDKEICAKVKNIYPDLNWKECKL